MRRDDRDDPFDDIFREIERLMDDVMAGDGEPSLEAAGWGDDAHVDVHETPDEVRVVADIPGVRREQLSLRCDGEVLTLGIDDDRRQVTERITLPARVDEHDADASFNNGVLEVRFDRADDSASIDV